MELLLAMSPGYQAEVARWAQQTLLQKVWFLDGAKDGFVVGLFQRFQLDAYPPREIVKLSQTLVCVDEGVAMLECKILTRAAVWGISDVLLSNPALFKNQTPLALSYLHVHFLTQGHLSQLISLHPDERRRLRNAAIKVALCRGLAVRFMPLLSDVQKTVHGPDPGSSVQQISAESIQAQAELIEGKFQRVLALMHEHEIGADPLQVTVSATLSPKSPHSWSKRVAEQLGYGASRQI